MSRIAALPNWLGRAAVVAADLEDVMGGFTLRGSLDSEQLAKFGSVACQSLAIPHRFWPLFVERVEERNFRALFRGEELVGGLGFYDGGQWFGGRVVRTAAVAGVGIAAEHRGSGAATELMSRAMREFHRDGFAISTLYASTQTVYRKVGFEQAGTRNSFEMPLGSIGLRDRSHPIAAVGLDDRTPFQRLYEERARRSNGMLARTDGLWDRVFSVPDTDVYAYLTGDADNPDGYVVFTQDERPSRNRFLHVRDLVTTTAASARRLWTLFADHRAIVDGVQWSGPAIDPFLALPAEWPGRVERQYRWMVRVVDVDRALTERGYPVNVAGELHLAVEDPLIAANSDSFVVTVSDGCATVVRGGRGDCRVSIAGLSPLYTGLWPATVLRQLGFLYADDASVQTAEQIFSGPEPWMVEIF